MKTVSFRVVGDPQPKGSTRAFALPIKGSVATHGKGPKYRAVTTSANPHLKRWEQTVAAEASLAAKRQGVFFGGPVAVRLVFRLLRPASVSAKKRPYPTVAPDLDKLVRASLDPLKGVLFRDDAQVIWIRAAKLYSRTGAASLDVSVDAMDDESADET